MVPYVVAEPCIGVKDKSCMSVCPVDCIYEGDDMVYIHPDECIDCGLCEPECPVTAIFVDTDVPAKHGRTRQVARLRREEPGRVRARSRLIPAVGEHRRDGLEESLVSFVERRDTVAVDIDLAKDRVAPPNQNDDL